MHVAPLHQYFFLSVCPEPSRSSETKLSSFLKCLMFVKTFGTCQVKIACYIAFPEATFLCLPDLYFLIEQQGLHTAIII